MKQFHHLSYRTIIFSAVILSLFLTSCSRDVYDSSYVPEQSSRYLTIEKAKHLVGRIAPPTTKALPNVDSALLPADYSIIWERAREESQGVPEAVEIPMGKTAKSTVSSNKITVQRKRVLTHIFESAL